MKEKKKLRQKEPKNVINCLGASNIWSGIICTTKYYISRAELEIYMIAYYNN